MVRKPTPDRRTVLETIGKLTAASVGMTAASGAATATETEELSGFYRGTVDRIVDGAHVVILVEDDDAVVAEFVESRDDYPGLEEGERVFVWLRDGDLLAVW